MTFISLFIVGFLFIHASFMIGWIYVGQLKFKNKKQDELGNINLDQLTVIIPFRNEASRILPLLKAIQASSIQPANYIFINDHSTDESDRLIVENINVKGFQVIHLPKDQQGKKRAISYGIKHACTEFVLTMDADVWFNSTYFQYISETAPADLIIFPVEHVAKNFFAQLFQQDVVLANHVNIAAAGWKRPILCSGANLLFRKEAYLEVVEHSDYFEKSSGDDIYLLKAMHAAGKNIWMNSSIHLEVKTPAANSIKEFISQRTRWISKTRHVADTFSNRLILIQFFLSIGFWAGLYLSFAYFSLRIALLFALIKIIIDGFCLFPFYYAKKELRIWLFLPIFILLLPIINSVLFITTLFQTPSWKNRLIE